MKLFIKIVFHKNSHLILYTVTLKKIFFLCRILNKEIIFEREKNQYFLKD